MGNHNRCGRYRVCMLFGSCLADAGNKFQVRGGNSSNLVPGGNSYSSNLVQIVSGRHDKVYVYDQTDSKQSNTYCALCLACNYFLDPMTLKLQHHLPMGSTQLHPTCTWGTPRLRPFHRPYGHHLITTCHTAFRSELIPESPHQQNVTLLAGVLLSTYPTCHHPQASASHLQVKFPQAA